MSSAKVPVQNLWEEWSTPSLPLLPGPDHHSAVLALFLHMPRSLVIIFQTLSFFPYPADFWSFKQPTNTCHTLPALPSWCWPQSCLLMVSHSWSNLSPPHVPHKNICVQHSVISIHLLKYFKCFWQSFPQLDQKFQVYSLLNVHHSFLSTHSWITWKGGSVNKKNLWKKIQWLQKARIIVI